MATMMAFPSYVIVMMINKHMKGIQNYLIPFLCHTLSHLFSYSMYVYNIVLNPDYIKMNSPTSCFDIFCINRHL